MKSRMKKLIGAVTAAVLTCAVTMGAMAAPSPDVSGVVSEIISALDASGHSINIRLSEAPAKYQAAVAEVKNTENLKNMLGSAYTEGMSVVDVKEVNVPDGTSFPVTITFSVPGVTAGSNVAVLYYNGSTWEVVSCKAGSGTIEATFSSLPPGALVAFVVGGSAGGTTPSPTTTPSTTTPLTTTLSSATTPLTTTTSSATTSAVKTTTSASSTSTTSPKTGETDGITAAAVAALLAAGVGGVLFCRRKRA